MSEHPEPAALPRVLAGVEGRYLGRTQVAQANDVIEVADVATLLGWRPEPADVVALGAGG